SVYAGELSVQATSAQAEQIAEHPGLGVAVPGPQGAPTSGGFESGAGPAGPTGNTVRPEGRWMPDAAPQSTPTGGAEGFIAKAAAVLSKAEGGDALLGELRSLLSTESTSAQELGLVAWPNDLSSQAFLDGK